MCQFCVQHGDGEKWYLEASNYAFDLRSDLKRREYVVDFIRDFDANRAKLIAGLDVLNAMPAIVREPVRRRVERAFRENHFGQPAPIEDCERIFDIVTSVVRMPCVCRRFAGTRDEAWCMAITTSPIEGVLAEGFAGYTDGPDISDFDRLTKAEAMRMLRDAEDVGLMHSVWTFVTPFIAAICNCDLASGCMAMRTTLTLGTKIMFKGHHVASIDDEACTGCKRCVGHCPFGAISWEGGTKRARVREGDCWGCGVCRASCSSDAIALRDRASVPAIASVW